MLFPLNLGGAAGVSPSVCRPPGCCSGLHKRKHVLLCFAAKQLLSHEGRMREVFKCSSEVQRRLREGVQRERGWSGGGTRGVPRSQGLHNLPPTSLKENRV